MKQLDGAAATILAPPTGAKTSEDLSADNPLPEGNPSHRCEGSGQSAEEIQLKLLGFRKEVNESMRGRSCAGIRTFKLNVRKEPVTGYSFQPLEPELKPELNSPVQYEPTEPNRTVPLAVDL